MIALALHRPLTELLDLPEADLLALRALILGNLRQQE